MMLQKLWIQHMELTGEDRDSLPFIGIVDEDGKWAFL